MTKICRTCLKVGKDDSCDFVNLNSVVLPQTSLSTQDKLMECIPELLLGVVQDPFMCNSCLSALETTHDFWSTCLRTEEKIRDYLQKNGRSAYVDLSCIVRMDEFALVEAKHDVSSDGDQCVVVECVASSEMQEQPDFISVNYLVPGVMGEVGPHQDIKVEADDGNEGYSMLGYLDTTEDYSNGNEEIIEVLIKGENADENSGNEVQPKPLPVKSCAKRPKSKSLRLKSNKWKKSKKRATLPLTKLNEYLSHGNIKEKRHMCHVCDKPFSSNSILKTHMTVHTGEKPHKCDTCGNAFNFKNNLQRHIMTMHGTKNLNRRFKCDVCGKSFTRNEHLHKHVISHTEGMRYQCTLCDKLFKYKDSLRGHLKYHNGEKRFRCDICGNGFIRRDNLHVHLKTVHVNQESFECTICDEKYLEDDINKQHLKRHTNIFNCKCETCGKLFRTKHTLRMHRNTHLAVKPYKCNICEHTFSQKGSLTQHVRTHTGEKPFICFLCEKSFAHKVSLRTHLQKHRRESGHFIKEEIKEEICEDVLP